MERGQRGNVLDADNQNTRFYEMKYAMETAAKPGHGFYPLKACARCSKDVPHVLRIYRPCRSKA